MHKWHHEYNKPVSISNQYAHPIEHALNTIAAISGLLILGKNAHFSTAMIWGAIRIYGAHEGHSGYEFPWSPIRLLPFGSDATYHDFHHSKNVCNYSSFMTIWDTIFDSNKEYYAYKL